ncbi:MAG TPA: TetR-like C-terminal domain-containing protein [Yinghuangia sp.]|uniref:TetR-like C-terminal domain-containing protein n=1 Tax=Yinghuangia sp. YIM S10712 TaxID=3436930 RepID=UPI002D01B47B|nr:TetR-like C-terminal domain-containing protein [Yinghuangia sp.]
MRLEPARQYRARDRRVRRSRSALLAAALRLVSERGTTAVPAADLADAADVSRRLIYLQFADRESLLVEAAADLIRRDLLPRVDEGDDSPARVLAMTRHFAEHRSFYRAMLTGSCSFAMTRTLRDVFRSVDENALREHFGDHDTDTIEDLTTFVAAGIAAIVGNWLIEGEDPLVPEELADRILHLSVVFAGSRRIPGSPTRARTPADQPHPATTPPPDTSPSAAEPSAHRSE